MTTWGNSHKKTNWPTTYLGKNGGFNQTKMNTARKDAVVDDYNEGDAEGALINKSVEN